MTGAILLVFLLFYFLEHGVEAALSVANLRHVARAGATVPEPLRGRVSEETARHSRDYALARGRPALAAHLCGAAFTLAVLLSGFLPWLDGSLAAAGLRGAHRFVAFLAALSALYGLAGLPWSLWSTFAVEARFGFNRTTWRTWLWDQAKGLLLVLFLGVPLAYATHAFMAGTGRLWWLWLFGFLAAMQLAVAWLYPALIAPLFNTFSPLPRGELRERLEALARDAGFANRGLFVMDASRRSTHSNAYFTGLVRPRIVLFDTLVKLLTAEEVAAVLAHEMGHFQKRHVQRRLALGLLASLLGLWVLSLLVAWPALFHAFGFEGPSWHAALALVSLGGGAFTFFLAPLWSWLSRRHEYAADRHALGLSRAPRALASALVKLGGENLSNLHPHPWYSRWYHSHPTLLQRLAAIEAGAPAG